MLLCCRYAKPDKRAFHGALERLAAQGIAKQDILHVAQSQYHDIGAAKELGIPVMWIERRHGKKGLGGEALPVALMLSLEQVIFASMCPWLMD